MASKFNPEEPSTTVVVVVDATNSNRQLPPEGSPTRDDDLNVRNVLTKAVAVAAPDATLHALVVYDAGDRMSVPSDVRKAVSHVYMTCWDVFEELGKPLIQAVAFPVPAARAEAEGQPEGEGEGEVAWEPAIIRRVLGMGSAVRNPQVPVFTDSAHVELAEQFARKAAATVAPCIGHLADRTPVFEDDQRRRYSVTKAGERAFIAPPNDDDDDLEQPKVFAVVVPGGVRLETLVEVVPDEVTAEMRAAQDIVSLNSHSPTPVFDHVVMGGTFDHMHPGHRQLLTMASLTCGTKGRLVVGVTSDAMLHKKKFRELIEPVEARVKGVEHFLATVNPAIEVEVHVINDPGGPSVVDPLLQAIVVSSETVRGGVWVNDKREANGLNRLTILTVERSAAATCSSTYLRQYLSSQLQEAREAFDASAAAEVLVSAWASRGHSLLSSIADVPHPPSINEVYDVHDAMRCHPVVKEALGGCAGFKVGGIGAAVDPATNEPVPAACGFLVGSGIYNVSESTSPAPSTAGSVGSQNLFMIEAEIGFVMARDVGPLADGSSRDAAAVLAAVQDIHLCIELCGRRFNLALGSEATSLQSLADAACAGAVVVGPPITPIDVEDLRDVHTAIEINGKVMGTGSTKANPLGGPIQSLTWCVNHLTARGTTIKQGHVIIAGACCKTGNFKAGDLVRVTFDQLGAVEIVLGE